MGINNLIFFLRFLQLSHFTRNRKNRGFSCNETPIFSKTKEQKRGFQIFTFADGGKIQIVQNFNETYIFSASYNPVYLRQTLLFSATQTTQISKLARLSLQEPVYVNTSANSKSATPVNLSQTYCVVKSEDKLNFLYSFMKNVAIKGTMKTVVFFSTCKQVMHAKGWSELWEKHFIKHLFFGKISINHLF